jgi:putative FmdB family regulatory protein
MPTYEYRCTSCAEEFEKFQRMSDEPVAECPECGSRAERRLSAGGGLLFKGSGFYSTDYRGPEYKKAADAEIKSTWKPDSLPESKGKGKSGEGSAGAEKKESKTESKAEPKTPSKSE